jgi:hypothetical protein
MELGWWMNRRLWVHDGCGELIVRASLDGAINRALPGAEILLVQTEQRFGLALREVHNYRGDGAVAQVMRRSGRMTSGEGLS